MSNLTKKDAKFKWEHEDQVQLDDLLEEAKTETFLSYPDHNGSYRLETDASDDGLGAVLKQNNKIIGFIYTN